MAHPVWMCLTLVSAYGSRTHDRQLALHPSKADGRYCWVLLGAVSLPRRVAGTAAAVVHLRLLALGLHQSTRKRG